MVVCTVTLVCDLDIETTVCRFGWASGQDLVSLGTVLGVQVRLLGVHLVSSMYIDV